MGKKTYGFCYLGKRKDFNKRQLTFLKLCVTSLLCVHGPIHGRFKGFYVNDFLSI